MDLTNLVARYKEKIGDIETAQNFLDKFNPWTNNAEIINSFWEAIEQNSTSFSWTHIDSNLKTLKLTKMNITVSQIILEEIFKIQNYIYV